MPNPESLHGINTRARSHSRPCQPPGGTRTTAPRGPHDIRHPRKATCARIGYSSTKNLDPIPAELGLGLDLRLSPGGLQAPKGAPIGE